LCSIAVPGEPRKMKVEALNSTAINVQWRPPADREHNGVIRGYLVTYVRMNDREESIGEARVFDVMNGEPSSVTYSTVYLHFFKYLL
jgi:Fibronectin type III domain